MFVYQVLKRKRKSQVEVHAVALTSKAELVQGFLWHHQGGDGLWVQRGQVMSAAQCPFLLGLRCFPEGWRCCKKIHEHEYIIIYIYLLEHGVNIGFPECAVPS